MTRRIALAALAALAACWQPYYPEGLTCAEDGSCPPGQTCSSNHRCYRVTGPEIDASLIDGPPMIDSHPIDAPMACTLAPQGGCGIGQKCTVDTTAGDTTCVATGATKLGYQCTTQPGVTDPCVAGAICTWGTCTAFCTATDNTCGTTEVCNQFTAGSSTQTIVFGACAFKCDPLSPNCPGQQHCYISSDINDAPAATCALSAANIAIGSACNFSNDCVGGATCTSAKVCAPYCDYSMYPGQQGTCAAGKLCNQIFAPNVGVCE